MNRARAHPLGRQLGGSGTDARNLVTLYQNPANSPIMSAIEGHIRRVVEAGNVVDYRATPIYRGSELIPLRIRVHASTHDWAIDLVVPNVGRRVP